MVPARDTHDLRDALIAALLTVALVLTTLAVVYAPLEDWWRLPLIYSGDGLWSLFVIKTVVQTGWYGENPMLGAPFGANFLDFAKPELLHLGLIRLLGAFTSDPARIHNLFWLSGFVLTSLAALAVLRHGFGLQWPLAVAGAWLFTCLPFHFLRQAHLFLASYYAIPLVAWLVLQVAGKQPPFFADSRLSPGRWPVWLSAFVTASTSIYYAFFGLVLISATGLIESLRQHRWRPAVSAALVCLLISTVVFANLAPSLWHRHQHGTNPEVAKRSPEEVEIHALRLSQMLLPSVHHRAPILAELAKRHEAGLPFVNENRTASLGFLASIGCLLMGLGLLASFRHYLAPRAIGPSARASAVAIGLAIYGGGGTLIALFISPQFRALNRISVVIGFFALAVLLLWLQKHLQRCPQRYRRLLTTATAAGLLAFGAWDQIPISAQALPPESAAAFHDDRQFVTDIEHRVSPGARILQLPHIGFPEAAARHKEGYYAHLAGFIHSDRLRWSYGVMKGRPGDAWLDSLAQHNPATMIRMAATNGFEGIWLDRRAFADHGTAIESQLQAAGLQTSVEDRLRNRVFYRMQPTDQLPTPMLPLLGEGFHSWEHSESASHAWTRGDATLTLHRPQVEPAGPITVKLALSTLVARQVEVLIDDEVVARGSLEPGQTTSVQFRHQFGSAPVVVQLRTDHPAVKPPNHDPRLLAMALMSVTGSE